MLLWTMKEFGIYRQLSGGNYLVSVMQVINSLALQRLHLFRTLDMKKLTVAKKFLMNMNELHCIILLGMSPIKKKA